MSFLEKLDEDLKTALRNSEKLKLSVLRLVKAAIKNEEIKKTRELSDAEILAVFSSLAKQRKESIDLYLKGGREDLAEQERQELSILHSYMPRQLSDGELENIIRQAVRECSASGEADLGKIMKLVMPRIKGVADGKKVNNMVRELLRSSQR